MSRHIDNGLGRGGGTVARLEKLLAHAQADVEALTRALALLRGGETERRTERQPTVLDQALALDAARRGRPSSGRPPHKAYGKLKTQRAKTLAALDKFSTTEPRTPRAAHVKPRLMGVLVRRGYVAKTADGYLRTDKVFTV